MAHTLILNGEVVSPTGTVAADVLIDGEMIAAVGAPGFFTEAAPTAEKVIDAGGKYASPAASTCTPIWSCRSAARSPPTRSRPAPWRPRGAARPRSSTSRYRAPARACRRASPNGSARPRASARSTTGSTQIIGGVDDESLKAMRYLTEHEGVSSFKLFMAYPGVFYSDDGQILRAMQTASECGATIMMHAENGIAIDVLIAQVLARRDRPPLPRRDATVRPRGRGHAPRHRAREGGRQHAALRRAHDGRRRAGGDRGRPARRPQRLRRDLPAVPVAHLEETLQRPGFEAREVGVLAAGAVAERRAPSGESLARPPYERARDRLDRPLSVLLQGPEELGLGDFTKIPNGMGSVEHRMELYQGVVTGELSVERWVETCCTTPARMFGMYPRKGVVALAPTPTWSWDPNGRTTIGIDDKHHMNVDYSAYEGFVVDGKVDTVFPRAARS